MFVPVYIEIGCLMFCVLISLIVLVYELCVWIYSCKKIYCEDKEDLE